MNIETFAAIDIDFPPSSLTLFVPFLKFLIISVFNWAEMFLKHTHFNRRALLEKEITFRVGRESEFTSLPFVLLSFRMIGGGRHMASRRRGSSPMIRANLDASEGPPGSVKGISPRRRRACAVQDHKSCALIQTRLKLGELV